MDLLDSRLGSLEMHLAELLEKIEDRVPESVIKGTPGWPKLPRTLRGQLSRLKPAFQAAGITVVTDLKRDKKGQPVKIFRTSKITPQAPSEADEIRLEKIKEINAPGAEPAGHQGLLKVEI